MLTLIVASSYSRAKSWCIRNGKQITDRTSVQVALHPYSIKAFNVEQAFELVVLHDELHPVMIRTLKEKGLLHEKTTE